MPVAFDEGPFGFIVESLYHSIGFIVVPPVSNPNYYYYSYRIPHAAVHIYLQQRNKFSRHNTI